MAVSVRIEPGETVGMVGRNGTGKTTPSTGIRTAVAGARRRGRAGTA
ncbi:ATP-binding cassette domain-containing protein [Nocardia sp. NPDC049526]